ncbi:hypothetical protein CROQUDRAFT_695956, partial [Cronartium quercuum f. sp. fusiforme G11]
MMSLALNLSSSPLALIFFLQCHLLVMIFAPFGLRTSSNMPHSINFLILTSITFL